MGKGLGKLSSHTKVSLDKGSTAFGKQFKPLECSYFVLPLLSHATCNFYVMDIKVNQPFSSFIFPLYFFPLLLIFTYVLSVYIFF